MERIKILEKVDIFRGLSPTQLEAVAQLSEEAKYRSGQVVFAERNPGKEMYVVKKGKVYFVLAILAGIFIAFGAEFYTLVVHDKCYWYC